MIIRAPALKASSRPLRPTLAEQRWFQALAGITLSTVCPSLLLLAIWPNEVLWSAGVQNSVVAAIISCVAGLLWYRRLVRHPGVQGLENVLTAFITTFAAAAATLLLARIDYSRVYISTSFLFTLSGFALMASRLAMTENPHFLVVPFGSYDRLSSIENGRWTVMSAPTVPTVPLAGLVADLRAPIPPDWERMMADAVLSGIPVFHLKQIEEALSGRVDIEHMHENQFGSLLPSLGYRKLKTAVDIAVAIVLLPLLAVPFVIVAILVKLDSPGPVFYRQPRVGLNGKMFSMIKFRSMRQAPPPGSNDARLAAMTQSDDARITRWGKFMRHYRIDELPQILNVLRGEMSWIGPRPEALALSQWYSAEIPFYRYRHIVKPGLSGWAQVNQGHVTDLDAVHEKLRYDFYYIKYFSFWLDLLIAIRTVRIILGGFGAK